nr:secretory carrier-associated membrane protein 2-like [Tanacetum cinerariifolium]
MAGRFDPNPFDDGDEVNPFADGNKGSAGKTNYTGGSFYTTSVPAATNSRLSPLPHEPADFYDRSAPVDIPLDSASVSSAVESCLFQSKTLKGARKLSDL